MILTIHYTSINENLISKQAQCKPMEMMAVGSKSVQLDKVYSNDHH